MSGHYAVWLYAFIALCFTFTLQTKDPWGKIQRYPANKIPDNALSPQRSIVRRKIVLYHNFFRSKVQPTASNMLLMTWHEGAARQAQEYAEKCKFLKHNPPSDRNVPNLNSCGQNLFVAAQKTPWFFVLKNWFIEYQNFTYGHPIKDLKPIGHYTQMVWATSHKLGCGFAKCTGGPWGHFYNYVCHYCPGGNYENKTHYPYKTGKKCGDCPNDCVSNSLCSNTCPVKDFYANCGELFKITNSICQQGTCNATCLCGDKKIYKEYPWN